VKERNHIILCGDEALELRRARRDEWEGRIWKNKRGGRGKTRRRRSRTIPRAVLPSVDQNQQEKKKRPMSDAAEWLRLSPAEEGGRSCIGGRSLGRQTSYNPRGDQGRKKSNTRKKAGGGEGKAEGGGG